MYVVPVVVRSQSTVKLPVILNIDVVFKTSKLKESVKKEMDKKEENNKYDHKRKRSKSPQRNRNKYGE